MNKDKDFTEKKLKNLFDDNASVKLELTDSIINKIDNLPEKHRKTGYIPVYRRKAFFGVALCSVFIMFFALMMPKLLSNNSYNDLIRNDSPENSFSDSSDIFEQIINYSDLKINNQEAAIDTTAPKAAISDIEIEKTMKFTITPQNSNPYIESVCGTGDLNVMITYFNIDNSNIYDGTLLYIYGSKGSLKLLGNKNLIFNSDNSIQGQYSLQVANALEIIIDLTTGLQINNEAEISYIIINASYRELNN